MWWENLNVLEAVSRCGSMAQASRELSVDKATVSRHMRQLARSAPAPLFEPRARGIALTPYGTRAVEAYRAHEESRRSLMAELVATEHDVKGTVRLTVPTFFAQGFIVPALGKLARRHPEIALQIDASNRVVDMTRDQADVALRNLRPAAPGLASRRVAKLGVAMYAARSYLTARGGLIAPHDLRGHDIIGYDTGHYAGPGFAWLPEAARRARLSFAANDADTLRDAARAGLGLAVLPHCVGDASEGLCRVEGGGEGVTDVFLVTREAERRVPRVRAVVQFLNEHIRSQQARLYAPRAR
jgi:DNA-binding transcriptional LysR family regulator